MNDYIDLHEVLMILDECEINGIITKENKNIIVEKIKEQTKDKNINHLEASKYKTIEWKFGK